SWRQGGAARGGPPHDAAAGNLRDRHRPRRAARACRPYVRAVRLHPRQRHRPRPCAGGQGGGRPRRRDRIRTPERAAPHHHSYPFAVSDPSPMTQPATILLADDDEAIRTVLRQALVRAGHEVKVTDTAAGLWKWIEDGIGDVAITDVVMPDENGLDLLPRIAARRPDLPVIVMSAQNTLATAVKATERGAFEYLPKPFDINEVKGAVQSALERVRAGRTARGKQETAPQPEDELPLIGRSAAM